jgi:hypothetical protein
LAVELVSDRRYPARTQLGEKATFKSSTNKRARLLLAGNREDGEKTEDLTAAFRREFRSSLLVASGKGLADMLLAAGMPFAGKRAHGWSSAGDRSAHAPTTATSPLRQQPPRGHSVHPGSALLGLRDVYHQSFSDFGVLAPAVIPTRNAPSTGIHGACVPSA